MSLLLSCQKVVAVLVKRFMIEYSSWFSAFYIKNGSDTVNSYFAHRAIFEVIIEVH